MSTKTVVYKIGLGDGELSVNLCFLNGLLLREDWRSSHHCNADYELHFILKGKCDVAVEDERHELCDGKALLISPGKYHKPEMLSPSLERLSMSFTVTESALSRALKEAVETSVTFLADEEFIWYSRKLIEEGASKKPLKDVALKSLLTLLSTSFLRILGLVSYVETADGRSEAVERTQQIDNFFSDHYAEKSGCAALAEALHVSTKQLGRILKKHYGMGFQEKLIRTRMDHAALMLRTTDARVQDIIEAVGYSSYEAFYKAFVERFGTNPQKYRRAYKNAEK